MINILKIIILKLFSLLPNSPFTSFYGAADTGFLTYLDWFLPIQTCSTILLAWLECVAIYYMFLLVKKVASNIISGIAKTITFVS